MSNKENDDHKEGQEPNKQEQIVETGTVKTKSPRGNIHCLTIIGQIEGHDLLPPQNKTTKYEHVLPLLVSVEEDDEIDGLLILLNTVGGDVEAGLAIAEMISGMKKPTVSLVLGGGHSIGVPLAVSADYSFIAPSATMTVHPLRMNGIVLGVSQMFEYLNKMQDRIIRFVVHNSNISFEKFKELMLATDEMARDMGTVLLGKAATECGLIDEVGGVSDALEMLYSKIAKNRKNHKKQKGKAENPNE